MNTKESLICQARRNYHRQLLGEGVLTIDREGVPSNADKDSKLSVAIARGIADRLQAEVSEKALGLIRNRKGHLPHIVVVTAEPLPSRLASLALGTGDIDCVYHFALDELMKSVNSLDAEDAQDMLNILVGGKRLKDIGDLPLDLAV